MQIGSKTFLYWVYSATIILEIINLFWFKFLLSPLICLVFILAFYYPFKDFIIYTLSYGLILDLLSGGPFGQHIFSFFVFGIIFYFFRKYAASKSNLFIFIPGSILCSAIYFLSIYFWEILFNNLTHGSMQSFFALLDKNLANLIINFALIMFVYAVFFIEKKKNRIF